MVELQSYQLAGMRVFWGEDLKQRSPLPAGHISKEKTEQWFCWWIFIFFDF